MPPRVIATTARQAPPSGPCPSSRQASARESRWIWSQETWKPFSCGSRSVIAGPQVAASFRPKAAISAPKARSTQALARRIGGAGARQREDPGDERYQSVSSTKITASSSAERRPGRARRHEADEDRAEEHRRLGVGELGHEAEADAGARLRGSAPAAASGSGASAWRQVATAIQIRNRPPATLKRGERDRRDLEEEAQAEERGERPGDGAEPEAEREGGGRAEALGGGGAHRDRERRPGADRRDQVDQRDREEGGGGHCAASLRPETTSMSGASSAFMPTTW